MRKVRLTALVAACALALPVVAACGGQEQAPASAPTASQATAQAVERAAAPLEVPAGLTPVTDADFTSTVLSGAGTKLVLFTAPWCGPCRQQADIVAATIPKFAEKLAYYYLDVDGSPDTPSRNGVRGIPTIMLFRDGVQVAKRTGLSNQRIVEEWLYANA